MVKCDGCGKDIDTFIHDIENIVVFCNECVIARMRDMQSQVLERGYYCEL